MGKVHDRRWFLAPCGLDCHGCPIRLRTEDELAYWSEHDVAPDKIRCDGCRSDRNTHHWSPDCAILNCCVYERGHEFCAQCTDFPCTLLEDWASEYEHHAQAVAKLKRMKEMGVEQWLGEKGSAD